MKCYTFFEDTLTEGIETGEKAVTLGESNPGGRLQVMHFCTINPPEVQGGVLFQAYPIEVPGDQKFTPRFVLSRLPKITIEDRDTGDILVRVNTRYFRTEVFGVSGFWIILQGTPRTLMLGFGSDNHSSRGRCDDGLIVMSPGDALSIHYNPLIPSPRTRFKGPFKLEYPHQTQSRLETSPILSE